MTPTSNPNAFDPPTAAQLSQHLDAHPPAVTPGWQAHLPVVVMVLLGLSLLLVSNPAFALAPWLGLMGFVVYMSARVRAAREMRERVTRAWELAMIRRYREALGQAWDLVPACRSRPELHGRAVTVIAQVLTELSQREAADVAYRYLLDRLPADHPMALRLRIQRAMVALGADRLADADEQLRQLRGRAEASGDPALRAAYHQARLLQDVHTGHYADAAGRADTMIADLRPLGIEAGFGYGLVASCFDGLANRRTVEMETDERQRLAAQAKQWWDRATLLIPPAALCDRYPALQPIAEKMRRTPAHNPTTDERE